MTAVLPATNHALMESIMAFVVYVKILDDYKQLSIFDEYASSLCEDKNGQISDRDGSKNDEYKFSVKEDKKSTPPGLITVTATLTPDKGAERTVTVEYPIQKSGEHFAFPKPA